MKVNVLYFAQIAQIAGCSKEVIEIEDGSSSVQLNQFLVKKYPAFEQQPYQVAINQQLSKEGVVLQDGDEVALLPPFAGG